MPKVIKGASSAVTSNRQRFVPGSGFQTVYQTGFTNLSDAEALFAVVAGEGYQAEIDRQGPIYTVEYVNPTSDTGQQNEVPVDLWEVPPLDADKSIFETAEFRALTDDEQLQLRSWDQTISSTPPDLTGNADTIYDLLRKGTDHTYNATSSVRWTRTVSNTYSSLGGTFSNVRRIWSTSSILSLSPPALVYAYISAAANAHPSAGTGYAKGWLKKQPYLTQRGLNKFDITMEWTLENWSTFLYGNTV